VIPTGAEPDILVYPDSLYFEIQGGKDNIKKDMGYPPQYGSEAQIARDVQIEIIPVTSSISLTKNSYHPIPSISDPETLYYDDGSFENSIGLTSSGGFTPDDSETYGFATKFSHTPTNLYSTMLYFPEFAGSLFRLYVWDDNGGVPNSGGTPIWVNMEVVAPTPNEWFSLSLDTIPVPDPFWIGVIYNIIGSTGSPDWRIGYDENTVDTHTFGNLSGEPGDWSSMSDYGYGYAFGVRAVIGGVGIIHDTSFMWVKNIESGILSVTDITWNESWIKEVNPRFFNVPEGDSVQVTVIAANDDLAGGVYYDTLQIMSNDPDEPVYNEPCILVILETGIEEIPKRFEVFPAYPSPMRSKVNIAYSLPDNIKANLKIYDISGRLIRTFENITNEHSPITWHGRDKSGRTVPAGIYFCSLSTEKSRTTRKIVKIK
ncbi:T9SS type A sorting domain-containing protein, partial [candidate division WOR-3 bacterium]|nr:T9SS type A sorting domain-containing protein [candidate division WOR-3 bacterium]